MAQTRTPAATVPSAAQQIEQHLRDQNYSGALAILRNRSAASPDPIPDDLIRQVYRETATHYADVDNAIDFNRVMKSAAAYAVGDPGWQQELAILNAYGGQSGNSQSLPPGSVPENADAITAARIDRAIRIRKKDWLAAELHAGFDSIHTAFTRYEAGDDAGCRAALEGIGLRSLFLEWKLLLRGLMAYAAGEDARAIENWSRLNPRRLPIRLVDPIRAQIDPAFRAEHPERVGRLDSRYQKSATSPLVATLRQIQRNLNERSKHATAFRQAEIVVSEIKKQAPQLLPRLANCFYHAVIQHGEPADMGRFRHLFGAPVDDPHFSRLEGLILDAEKCYEDANHHWLKYLHWLESGPTGWPKPLLARARAIIHHRVADNLLNMQEFDPEYEFPHIQPSKSSRKNPKAAKKAAETDPAFHLKQAVELAADWAQPYEDLYSIYEEKQQWDLAEFTLLAALAHQPDSLDILRKLAKLLSRQKRFDAALDYHIRAMNANPLDSQLRTEVAKAHLALAEARGIAGDLVQAEEHAKLAISLCPDLIRGLAYSLLSVIARKDQRIDEAESWSRQAFAIPAWRLAVTLRLSVDSLLLKLKPADKRVADQQLKAAFADTTFTPEEIAVSLAAFEQYEINGIQFRGQATHRKKILTLAVQTANTNADETDYEKLMAMLMLTRDYATCAKLGRILETRFPRNPYILLTLAKAYHLQSKNPPTYRIEDLLVKAHEAIRTHPQGRGKELLPAIEELEQQLFRPNFLNFMFR